ARRLFLVAVGVAELVQAARLLVHVKHNDCTTTEVRDVDALAVGVPGVTDYARSALWLNGRAGPFLKPAVRLDLVGMNATRLFILEARRHDHDFAVRTELHLCRSPTLREGDFGVVNGRQLSVFIHAKPRDVRGARWVGKRRRLIGHVDQVAVDGEAEWR